MKWLRRSPALVFFLLAFDPTMAQEQPDEEEKHFHRVSVSIAHTYISKGVQNDEKHWITMPSWAFDYDYWLTSRLALGLHNDIILESYAIEKSDDTIIERERPLSSIITANFKPGNHTVFILGIGGEFSDTENFAVARLGVEYGREIFDDSWEISASLIYDNKIDAYDSFALGFGLSKKFFSRKRDKEEK